MSLLVVEIMLALRALQRGWRIAPLLLVARPATVAASGSAAALPFAPSDPAVAKALVHGISLVGLLIACWAAPAERPTSGRAPGGAALRRTGSLYQI